MRRRGGLKIRLLIGAGIILLVLSLLFGYFTFSEYFPRWFSHKIYDVSLLKDLFSRYFWEFVLANYLGVLIPIAILSVKKFRKIKIQKSIEDQIDKFIKKKNKIDKSYNEKSLYEKFGKDSW